MRQSVAQCALFMVAFFCMVAAALANVTIDPPAGWKSVDFPSSSQVTYQGAWGEPSPAGDYRQNINLVKTTLPADVTLDAYVDLNMKQLKQLDSTILFTLNERSKCGADTMQHVKYLMTVDNGSGQKHLALEQLWVLDGATFYAGTYARLATQAEVPAASQALMTLCSHLAAAAN